MFKALTRVGSTGKGAIFVSTAFAVASANISNDLTQQCRIDDGRQDSWDLTQIGASNGLALVLGPTYHLYYKYIDRVFSRPAISSIARKVLLDQFCVALPVVTLSTIGYGLYNSRNRTVMNDEWVSSLVSNLKTALVFWLPVTTANFIFLPPPLRFVFSCSAMMALIHFSPISDSLENSQKNEPIPGSEPTVAVMLKRDIQKEADDDFNALLSSC